MDKKPFNILVVDDDEGVLASARFLLKQHYQLVKTLSKPDEMLEAIAHLSIDIVLLDMNYSIGEQEGSEGLNWITKIRKQKPGIEIIAITAYGDLQVAIDAMKFGVRDFITKPWENERLLLTINNVLGYQSVVNDLKNIHHKYHQLNDAITDHYPTPLGSDPTFIKVLDTCRKTAPTDAEIMITGENGTGKEIIASFVHKLSNRRAAPFVKVDLGSLPATLFESELFGHVRGAFTDAREDKMGKMELANGGTLFLDEIGNIPPVLQSKLLTALQQKMITPVGSNKSIKLDIRLITATNINLESAIHEGTFRQDLLYRINTIPVSLPSLKDRPSDIRLLSTHYLELFKDKYRKKYIKINTDGFAALEEYSWPGNVRELCHVIERAVILTESDQLGREELQLITSSQNSTEQSLNLQENEKSLILKALKKNNGNITHAARELGIDRLALYRRLEKYGL